MSGECPICGDEFDKTITKQEMFGEDSFNTNKYSKCIGGDTVYLHKVETKPIVYSSGWY